jgi:hypothetical protein
MWKQICLAGMIAGVSLYAQDFFDDSNQGEPLPYELSGFVRGAFFGGRIMDEDQAELKSAYGELGLKMRVRKGDRGDGFAEVRFRRGSEFGEAVSEFNIREAYVNVYAGDLDFRLGHQIVVWGRADGFNPTNNITPQNMLARSSDEDDRREGNFLMRAFYNLNPVRVELIWVPQYSASVLPIRLFPFPDYVVLGQAENPDANLKNSSAAVRINVETGKVEGSLSCFRGYMPMPGIRLSNFELLEGGGYEVTVAPKAYQMQVVGADFSTTMGSFGVRGEAAYRVPIEEYEDVVEIPHPDVQWVLGVDKTKGDFSVIVQYIGRYVVDFEPFESTGWAYDELILKNRMIASQLDEISHAVFTRPALALRHETMSVECLAYYSLTTEELLLRPSFSADLADALEFKLGAEWYTGPENTLFGSIEDPLSSLFIELKSSF